MIDKIIIDADLCIKLGGHKKYTFLYDILPLVADKIFMHTHAHGEVLMPSSAVQRFRTPLPSLCTPIPCVLSSYLFLNLSCALCNALQSRSKSSFLFYLLILILRALSARSLSIPISVNTLLASPFEQALPLETQIPSVSKKYSDEHNVHNVVKSELLVHVVHPVILLEQSEHTVSLDLYCPLGQVVQVFPLGTYIPPHVEHVVDEQVKQFVIVSHLLQLFVESPGQIGTTGISFTLYSSKYT